MLSSQNTHWILRKIRGHLKNAGKLFNDVSGGCHSQSPIWTLIKHIQLEKLYMYDNIKLQVSTRVYMG